MKVIGKLFFASLLLSSSLAIAEDYEVDICMLQSSDDGHAYLSPCGEWTTKHKCPSTGGWITWDIKTDGGKLMYGTALAAFMASKSVKIRTNGTCYSYDITSMIRILRN